MVMLVNEYTIPFGTIPTGTVFVMSGVDGLGVLTGDGVRVLGDGVRVLGDGVRVLDGARVLGDGMLVTAISAHSSLIVFAFPPALLLLIR